MWHTSLTLLLILHYEAVVSISPQALKLQNDVNTAVSSRKSSFQISSGEYQFDNTPFSLRSAKKFTLSAQGEVTLLFTIGGGMQVRDCENVTVRGISIDYSTPPYSQGVVTSVQGTTLTMKLDEGFPAPNTLPGPMGTDPSTLPVFWSNDTRQLSCVNWYRQTIKNVHPTPNSPNHFTMTLPGLKFDPTGQLITINPRVGYTYSVVNSSMVLTQKVSVYAASFMAITEFDGKGKHMYTDVTVTRRGNRLLASNADLFHSSGVQNGPTIENCTFGYANDDFINVHSTLVLVLNKISDNELWLVDPHLYNRPPDSVYGTVMTLQNVKPGDELSFYELNTLEGFRVIREKPIVDTIERVTDRSIVAMADKLRDVMNNSPYLAEPQIMPFTPFVYSVKFRNPLRANVAPYDTLVSFNQWAASGAIVKNNVFHHSTCNLGRWKSSNSLINGNVFQNACLNNFEVRPLQGWMEGQLGINNVTITHNQFINGGKYPFNVQHASNVHIDHNTYWP